MSSVSLFHPTFFLNHSPELFMPRRKPIKLSAVDQAATATWLTGSSFSSCKAFAVWSANFADWRAKTDRGVAWTDRQTDRLSRSSYNIRRRKTCNNSCCAKVQPYPRAAWSRHVCVRRLLTEFREWASNAGFMSIKTVRSNMARSNLAARQCEEKFVRLFWSLSASLCTDPYTRRRACMCRWTVDSYKESK